eukprot:14619498-Alexandrium_andersonii.AAC.1
MPPPWVRHVGAASRYVHLHVPTIQASHKCNNPHSAAVCLGAPTVQTTIMRLSVFLNGDRAGYGFMSYVVFVALTQAKKTANISWAALRRAG